MTKPQKSHQFKQLDFLLIGGVKNVSIHCKLPILILLKKKKKHSQKEVAVAYRIPGVCVHTQMWLTVLFNLLFSPAFSSYLQMPGTSPYLHDNLNIQPR